MLGTRSTVFLPSKIVMMVNGDARICNSIHDTRVHARWNDVYYGLFGFTISLKRVVSRPDDGRLCVQQVGERGEGRNPAFGWF